MKPRHFMNRKAWNKQRIRDAVFIHHAEREFESESGVYINNKKHLLFEYNVIKKCVICCTYRNYNEVTDIKYCTQCILYDKYEPLY